MPGSSNRIPSLKHGHLRCVMISRAVPTRNSSPMWTASSSRPAVVRFSPKIPGVNSRPSRSLQGPKCSLTGPRSAGCGGRPASPCFRRSPCCTIAGRACACDPRTRAGRLAHHARPSRRGGGVEGAEAGGLSAGHPDELAPTRTGKAHWSMPAWPAISSANSASKLPGRSSRRRSCIAWWPRNWEWRLPLAAWWRPTSGTRSGLRASVAGPA